METFDEYFDRTPVGVQKQIHEPEIVRIHLIICYLKNILYKLMHQQCL